MSLTQNLQMWTLIADKLKQTDAKAFPHCSFLHCLCTNMVGVKRVRLQSVGTALPHTSPTETSRGSESSKAQDGVSSLLKTKKNNFRSEGSVQGFHWKDMTEFIMF